MYLQAPLDVALEPMFHAHSTRFYPPFPPLTVIGLEPGREPSPLAAAAEAAELKSTSRAEQQQIDEEEEAERLLPSLSHKQKRQDPSTFQHLAPQRFTHVEFGWLDVETVVQRRANERGRFPPQVTGGRHGDYGVAGLPTDSLKSPPSASVGGLLSLGRWLGLLSIFNSTTSLRLPGWEKRPGSVWMCAPTFNRIIVVMIY